MNTLLRQSRTIESQVVAPFTGEGAYHGSTKPGARPSSPTPPPMVEEMRATTLEAHAAGDPGALAEFDAVFPARHETLIALPVPAQAEVRDDGVTFCWCPIDAAIAEAGPLTRRVLAEMTRHLQGVKRYVYIDSKIQYFEPGDLPVDSQHWHVDGTITARGPEALRLGHAVLHDMKARMQGPAAPPTYLTYQSSHHCAPLFPCEPVALRLPALIANFDDLDQQVRAVDPRTEPQPAAAIVRFDGLTLHRAVPASAAGWRLWIRCIETDRQVQLTTSIIECYGTVFRGAAQPRSNHHGDGVHS